ncbi:hypothetical protein [Methanobacterium sp.]|uniref:hypothetical protein n=1 Tax=Methanobacterium sp. TaxID=2164 RepID=UPI002ABA38C4|nr:hypothetical protein [Methanobacterium sp.]MDY9924285.1 hypothetical protein [Methanobacterium sp.]
MNTLIVIIMERGDKGALIPKRGYKKFIKNPINIRLTSVNPTVNKSICPLLSNLPNFINLISRVPGTKRINRNPITSSKKKV